MSKEFGVRKIRRTFFSWGQGGAFILDCVGSITFGVAYSG